MNTNATVELADWRRARRYAVPRWMIERATERRLAGDWRGACAAALVDVGFDLDDIAREHGAKVAESLEDDLLHLAPDLLRWHLPRHGDGRCTFQPRKSFLLAGYGKNLCLYVETPTLVDGPQRLRLGFGERPVPSEYGYPPRAEDYTMLRHIWDVRRADELLERSGGDDRAPFFRPDGTPLPADEVGGQGTAGFAERLTLMQEQGQIDAAFHEAGMDLEYRTSRETRRQAREHLASLPLALYRFTAEILLHAHAGIEGGGPYQLPLGHRFRLIVTPRKRPRVRITEPSYRWEPTLPSAAFRRLPDLDLLRAGLITPEELHPLVRSALFPARPAPDGPVGPPDPDPPRPVRVRCRGEWHEVRMAGGRLQMPHSEEEQDREAALVALGGATAGCFTVTRAWAGEAGRLPRRLRDLRKELFQRIQHGDTPGVVALLDAGVDPHVRDGRKHTLLHLLHMVDHRELLPRLLEAGLDLEARNQYNRTPLHMAVGEYGSPDLVRALVDAGARLDVVDDLEFSLPDLITRCGRTDLDWLDKRLESEYPDLGGRWLDEEEW